MINKMQKIIINTIKSKIGIDEDDYRQLLYSSFKVDSIKNLKGFEANQFISELENLGIAEGVWEKKKKSGYHLRFEELGIRGGMASPAQLRMIEAMWVEKSFMPTLKEKQTALNSFLNNKFKIARIEWITSDKVRNVIKSIESIKKRERVIDDKRK